MHYLRKKTWNPYVVGTCIGLLTVSSYLLSGSFIGISGSIMQILTFLTHHTLNSTRSWLSFMMPIGVVLGAYIAAMTSSSFSLHVVPGLWQQRFGDSPLKRLLVSFIGGIVLMYGARIAGGCTSGKAIGSGLQLLAHAWLFTAVLFLVGIICTYFLYRK